MVHRRVASARSDEEIDRVVAEVRDRYGSDSPVHPQPGRLRPIRVMADRLGIEAVDREGERLLFRFRQQQTKVHPETLVGLVQQRRDVTLVPPAASGSSSSQTVASVPADGIPKSHPKAEAAFGLWANIGQNR